MSRASLRFQSFLNEHKKTTANIAKNKTDPTKSLVPVAQKYFDQNWMKQTQGQEVSLAMTLALLPTDSSLSETKTLGGRSFMQITGKSTVKSVKGKKLPKTQSYWLECIQEDYNWKLRPHGGQLKL